MHILYLTDRLSMRGGADLHLRQLMGWAVARGWQVTLACGRTDRGVAPPPGVALQRLRGLASPVASSARLASLAALLASADVIHAQNVMNPVVVRRAVATGRALVTVQDHRMFCPGAGKTLPDGRRCRDQMADTTCRQCLPDVAYRERTLALTAARRDAVVGARIIVLSSYMAAELAAVGVVAAAVVPPWVEVTAERRDAGGHVLLAGRLVPHKGVLDGWRAWCVAGRPLPLRVAGEGPLADRLEGALRLGWLAPAALRHELRRARMLLFPARWQEPFGILGIEALAVGTPVVVAVAGGTDAWSHAGCVRVAPGDIGAMAAAISELAGDPVSAAELGERGRRAVADRFARERVTPVLEWLYRAAAAGV